MITTRSRAKNKQRPDPPQKKGASKKLTMIDGKSPVMFSAKPSFQPTCEGNRPSFVGENTLSDVVIGA